MLFYTLEHSHSYRSQPSDLIENLLYFEMYVKLDLVK